MSAKIDISNPPKDLEKLFATAILELEAFDSDLLVRRAISRQRALELTGIQITSWTLLAEQLDAELSKKRAEQRKAELARLDTRAWVFYAADLAAAELHSNTARKQRRALAKAVTGHDRFLFKWATPLFGDDPEHAETLRDISRGTGARDDAEDVLRLVALYRANWDQIKDAQKLVSKARLDQAAADATKQLDYLRNGTANPARKLADAAYSLWYYDYDELMQLGRYLTRREPDSVLRFPGVRELPTGTSGSEVESEVEDGEELDELDEQDDAQGQDADANPESNESPLGV